MARTIRNPKLDTRSARAKLATRKAPYWTSISPGCAFGYRKGAKGGTWLAKYVRDGVRKETAIGPADDALDAGGGVLSFAKAQTDARDWFQKIEQGGDGEPDASEPYIVGKALDDYMVWFRRHRKSVRDTERAIEAHIRPALGNVEIGKLSPAMIRDWHHKLADRPARLRTKCGSEQRYRRSPTDLNEKRARKATAKYAQRRKELENRPLIRAQAFGESLNPDKLERLARYEVHLDRKFERTLALLIRLQDPRRDSGDD